MKFSNKVLFAATGISVIALIIAVAAFVLQINDTGSTDAPASQVAVNTSPEHSDESSGTSITTGENRIDPLILDNNSLNTTGTTEEITPPYDIDTAIEQAIPFRSKPLTEFRIVSFEKTVEETRLVLTFAEGSTPEEQNTYIDQIGGELLYRIDVLNTAVVKVPEDTLANSLPQSAIVLTSEPDYFVTALTQDSNDPLLGEQWGLDAISATTAWENLPMELPEVTVAVIDSGVCTTHEDLAGRILDGWNFLDSNSNVNDVMGHGCNVAGIIAANQNNDAGIAGIAPNAQILPLRILNDDGYGFHSDIAAAIVYAIDHGAQIINMSFGSHEPSTILQNAVNYAVSQNVRLVAAAGNTGTDEVLYPAAYAPVIAVGAFEQNLEPDRFTSNGPEIGLLAPGRQILTTQIDGGYIEITGTSAAAAHVSGALALKIGMGEELVIDGGLLDLLRKPQPVAAVEDATPPPGAAANPEGLTLNAPGRESVEKPAISNMSSVLNELNELWENTPAEAEAFAITRGMEVENGRVKVMIIATDAAAGNTIASAIPSLGGEIIAHFEQWVDAWVPINQLEALSNLSGITLIQLPIPVNPADGAQNPSNEVRARIGTFLTQGVAASNANAWHDRGYNGDGIKVAVLDSFMDYTTAQSISELPASIATHGTLNTTSRHGTAVAEIIYDMAPGVQFTFASPGSATQMAQYIVELASQGNKIISSSMGFYLSESGDGTGPVSNAISTAHNTYGTLYVQAAGNQALYHWDGSFRDSDADNIHEFTSGAPGAEYNVFSFQLPAGFPVQLYLRWNNWPTTNQDYDLWLYRWNGTMWVAVANSINDQAGSALPPTESIVYITPQQGTYGILVNKFQATGNQVLDLMGHNQISFTENVSNRSLVDPATGPNSFSIAAVDVSTPYNRESYSSVGPTHGAGGSLNGGANKPRIAGFANVDTWAYGSGFFNGTSSATPHVSGAAALVMEANPGSPPGDIINFLENTAVDMGSAGYDYLYGMGRLFLGSPPALNAPANTNLVINGTFNTNDSGWSFFNVANHNVVNSVLETRSTTTGNAMFQAFNFEAQTGYPFEAVLQFDNTSTLPKDVRVTLHNTEWTQALSCIFTVPANNPGLQNFVLRGKATAAWSNIWMDIYDLTANGQGFLRIDNINVQYKPAINPPTTECESPTPPNTNLIANGNFNSGEVGWSFFNVASHSVVAGVLEYNATAANNAIYQGTGFEAATGFPFEISVDLGNTGTTNKNMQVILHNTTWTEFFSCIFTVQANTTAPLTFVMRGKTTVAWDNIWLDIYNKTADGDGIVRLDNVNVQYKPALVQTGVTCEAPIPSNTNIARNGDFASGEAEWNFFNISSHSVVSGVERYTVTAAGNSIYQAMNYKTGTQFPLEAKVDLANTSASEKSVQILLHNPTWTEYFNCFFTIPGNTPYLQTYTVRGKTTVAWDNIFFEVYDITHNGNGQLWMDNVNVQYKPALSITGQECIDPDPNLLVNGDFSNGEVGWNFFNIAQHNVVSQVLEVRVSQAGNAIYRPVGKPGAPGATYQLSMSLLNSSTANKQIRIVLHNPEWTETLGCTFILGASGQSLQTYTLRGVIVNSWSDIWFDIYDQTADGLGLLQIDNVSLQRRTDVSPPGVECESPTPADTNLVLNGAFAQGEIFWNFWQVSNHQVVSQQLEWYASQAGNAVFQSTGKGAASGWAFELVFEAVNTGAAPKSIQIVLHNTEWTDILTCIFTFPANGTTTQTYKLRARTNIAWSNIWLDMYDRSANGQALIRMDNVDLQYKPALNPVGTECDAPTPANTNLVRNGDFAAGEAEWSFFSMTNHSVNGSNQLEFHADSTNNAVYQALGYSPQPDFPIEAQFDFMNTSASIKNVRIAMHDAGWTEVFTCDFELSPGAIDFTTYTMRFKTTQVWNNMSLDIYDKTGNNQATVRADNISVQYKPTLNVSAVECIGVIPAVAGEELVRNGTFVNGETDWQFDNIVNHSVTSEVLNFYASSTPNEVFQGLNRTISADSAVEIIIDVRNVDEGTKNIRIYLHNPGETDGFFCDFSPPASNPGDPFGTYTIQGKVGGANWSNMVLSIIDQTANSAPTFQIDNVSAKYRTDINPTTPTCIPPGG